MRTLLTRLRMETWISLGLKGLTSNSSPQGVVLIAYILLTRDIHRIVQAEQFVYSRLVFRMTSVTWNTPTRTTTQKQSTPFRLDAIDDIQFRPLAPNSNGNFADPVEQRYSPSRMHVGCLPGVCDRPLQLLHHIRCTCSPPLLLHTRRC